MAAADQGDHIRLRPARHREKFERNRSWFALRRGKKEDRISGDQTRRRGFHRNKFRNPHGPPFSGFLQETRPNPHAEKNSATLDCFLEEGRPVLGCPVPGPPGKNPYGTPRGSVW